METSAHRKIELQSPEDLRYLIRNVTRAAQAKIDTHFGPDNPNNNPNPEARQKVEEIIKAYIHRTFSYALPNLSINGIDQTTNNSSLLKESTAEEEEEEHYERYDHQLAQRVQSLYATLETETLGLAQLRREAPVRAAKEFRERFEGEMREEDERWEEEKDAGVVGEEGLLDWEGLRLERDGDVRRTWGEGLEGLMGLKTTLPGTVAKLERAKTAVEYVESTTTSR